MSISIGIVNGGIKNKSILNTERKYKTMKNNKNRKRSKHDGQFNKLRRYTKNNSTFNPKIHHMSSNGIGYQMKNDVKADPKESLGSVLKNILYKPK